MAWRGGLVGVLEQGMHGEGSPGTWEASTSPQQSGGTAERRKRSEAEGVEESERLSTSDEAGEPTRGTPLSKGRRRGMRARTGCVCLKV